MRAWQRGRRVEFIETASPCAPVIGDAEFDHQYKTHLSDGEFQTYMIYKSQSGGQAWMFSLLDTFSHFSASTNLRLFRILTALLTLLFKRG